MKFIVTFSQTAISEKKTTIKAGQYTPYLFQ